MIYFLIAIVVFLFIMLMLCLFNRFLPKGFGCDTMGWHLEPKQQGFDGCSSTGKCSRCNKEIMQDGQGNWF